MFNSGVFLLRNSMWGRQFLDRTIDLLAAPMPQSFQHNQWHEQSPFMYLAMVPSLLDLRPLVVEQEEEGESVTEAAPAFARDDRGRMGYDPEHVRVVPQSWMNSYPLELVERTRRALLHDDWSDGDFIISFNGCGSVLGGAVCEEIFGKYWRQSQALGGWAPAETSASV